MLETIRKRQKGLMIIVAILVVIAFVFLYNRHDPSKLTQVNVSGQKIPRREYEKFGRSMRLMQQMGLGAYVNEWVALSQTLVYNNRSNPADLFIRVLLMIRQVAPKYGVHIADETAYAMIGTAFSSDGTEKVDQQFESFMNNVATPAGFNQGDIVQIAKDCLAYQQLKLLTAAPIQLPEELLQREQSLRNKIITADAATVTYESVRDSVKISDEEIEAYYKKNSQNYFSPQKVETQCLTVPIKITSKTDLDDGDSPAPTEDDKKTIRAAKDRATDIYTSLKTSDVTLADTAKSEKLELTKLPAFSYEEPPEQLAGVTQLEKEISAVIHDRSRPFTVPIKTAAGYVILKIDKIIEPQPLPLADVKKDIKMTLEEEAIRKAAIDQAQEKFAKISDDIKAGKTFAAAAKSVKLQTKDLPDLKYNQDYSSEYPINQAFLALVREKSGSVMSPVLTPEGARIIHVKKILLAEKNAEDSANQEDEQKKLTLNIRNSLFRSWFIETFNKTNHDLYGQIQ